VKVCPAIVSVPVRELPVFAWTEYTIVPLPLPFPPDVIVSTRAPDPKAPQSRYAGCSPAAGMGGGRSKSNWKQLDEALTRSDHIVAGALERDHLISRSENVRTYDPFFC
jgi:hypothetical protein